MTDLTTKQAAEALQVTERRVTNFIQTGRLKARKFGKSWAISAASLEKFSQVNRPSGKASRFYGKASRRKAKIENELEARQ